MKVLTRHVPGWHEKAQLEREQFLLEVERFLGSAFAERHRWFIESRPLDLLASVKNRIPYVETFEDLLDMQWRLKVDLLSTSELIHHAFGKPIRWGILLELRAPKSSGRLQADLLADAPWLRLLKNSRGIQAELIDKRLLAFRCPSETMAERLQSQVGGKALRCQPVGSGFREGGTGV